MPTPLLDLKSELLTRQQKGRKFLAIEKLVQYCDIADDCTSDAVRSEAEDRDYKHRMDVWRVEVDFYLDITFRISRRGLVVYTHQSSSHQRAPKTMTQDTEAIRSAISKCIDDFLLSARSRRLL